MLRFEFLCDSYRCYKGHVSKLTGKSSDIDSNKSATVKSVLRRYHPVRKTEKTKNRKENRKENRKLTKMQNEYHPSLTRVEFNCLAQI